MDTQALLTRIRKLLGLATSSNVHEAAAAAAQAQLLIERHRLAHLLEPAATDADPLTDGADAPLESARRPRRWKAALACGLAEVNGCVAYSVQRGGETELRVAGRASDRAVVASVWTWLVPRIEWLSATHGEGRNRAWHDAFRVGAADAVVERLKKAGAALEPELAQSTRALVLQDRMSRRAQVDAFASATLRLAKGRTLRVDARGFARGQSAGADLALPTTGKVLRGR